MVTYENKTLNEISNKREANSEREISKDVKNYFAGLYFDQVAPAVTKKTKDKSPFSSRSLSLLLSCVILCALRWLAFSLGGPPKMGL